jgi:hypothetical protein
MWSETLSIRARGNNARLGYRWSGHFNYVVEGYDTPFEGADFRNRAQSPVAFKEMVTNLSVSCYDLCLVDFTISTYKYACNLQVQVCTLFNVPTSNYPARDEFAGHCSSQQWNEKGMMLARIIEAGKLPPPNP